MHLSWTLFQLKILILSEVHFRNVALYFMFMWNTSWTICKVIIGARPCVSEIMTTIFRFMWNIRCTNAYGRKIFRISLKIKNSIGCEFVPLTAYIADEIHLRHRLRMAGFSDVLYICAFPLEYFPKFWLTDDFEGHYLSLFRLTHPALRQRHRPDPWWRLTIEIMCARTNEMLCVYAWMILASTVQASPALASTVQIASIQASIKLAK